MVYDRSRSVVLVQFEIGGPGSDLFSHDLGLILVVDLALEVCHRSDLGVFGFFLAMDLWCFSGGSFLACGFVGLVTMMVVVMGLGYGVEVWVCVCN